MKCSRREDRRIVRRSVRAVLLIFLFVSVSGATLADGSARRPRLRYATFFGGSSRDALAGMSLDTAGNVLLTGETSSRDFPIEAAPWPDRPNLPSVGFLSKIQSNGQRVVFSTYFPVEGSLEPFAVATDSESNIYVVGRTNTPDLPLVNAVQERQTSDLVNDAFLMKLSPDGSELLMSTYLGGTGEDLALALTVDDADVAYLTGYTTSGDFPADKTFGPSGEGGRRRGDVFVTGIDTVAGEIVFSAILAGERFERGNALAVDEDSVWVGGVSESRTFPVRRAVRRRVPNGYGAFVARIGLDGPRLLMSTRLGGGDPRGERVLAIALDAAGDAWVAGRGGGRRFPLAGDQEGLRRCPELRVRSETSFLAHLDRHGKRIHAGGCLTPGGDVIVGDVEVLPDGRVAVAGGARGAGLPLRNSLMSAPAGKLDVFVAVLDPVRGSLDLSSLYGARRNDFATDIGVGPDGRIVLGGQTETKQFPVFRALQPEKTSRAGIWDTFLLKIRL